MSARISAIIPVYNGAAFLQEAIESALRQSVPAAEILVVDDGSTDASADIARSFGPRVAVLSRENGGLSAARNTGLEASTGDIIAFLDADDIWTLDSLAVRQAALESIDGVDAVAGRVVQFQDETGVEDPPAEALLAGTMLLRRSVFERTGYFDQRLRVAEFVDWYSRARDHGCRFVSIDDVVLRRRLHDSNLGRTASRAGARVDYVRVVRAALERKRAVRSGQQ